MDIVAFEVVDFDQIHEMRVWLHNKQQSMTFDEQRDFAERLSLLLERGVGLRLENIVGQIKED